MALTQHALQYQRDWRAKNPKKVKAATARRNKKQCNENTKRWRSRNPQMEAQKKEACERTRLWKINNPEKFQALRKRKLPLTPERKARRVASRIKYRNRPEIRARFNAKRRSVNKERTRNRTSRYYTDIEYRLKCLLCGRLSRLMSNYNFRKSRSMLKLLGCTLEFFKTYMASKFTEGMSFDNHGEWHIDHDVACRKFDLKNPDHQRACFHFSNLQPLWGVENVGKDSLSVPKLTDAEVAKMLESQAFLTRILPVPLQLAA